MGSRGFADSEGVPWDFFLLALGFLLSQKGASRKGAYVLKCLSDLPFGLAFCH